MFLLPSLLVSPANAAGSLYVSPANIASQAAGNVVEYQIKVADIDPFNGWDIMVRVDQNAILPETISHEVNLLTANSSAQLLVLRNCVNGSGEGCTTSDGPGVVHSAAVALGSTFDSGTASGVLFTITYRAITRPTTDVTVLEDLIVLGSEPVPHATSGATYGAAPPGPIVGGTLESDNPILLPLYTGGAVALAVFVISLYMTRGRRRNGEQ